MKKRLRHIFQTVGHRPHLKRTGLVAAIVGSWLCAFNLGDVILSQGLNAAVLGKIALNYATPFIVANLGLLSKTD